MQHSQRLDQRLHMLRKEVRTMTQDKERGEQVWRERLQRCQRQLKAKEDEMSRQCQYFENYKTQLQQKLSLAQDREQSLQNRIYTLEKQLLDMTVSAATGMVAISAVRITAGTVTRSEEQERLPPMRGEGEGEEERKEEKRKQWQPSESTTEKNRDANQNSNEARLQGFILSLQEDLQVLLEREEDGTTQRRGLMEQLQETQENSRNLDCKVEEMKAEVHLLRQSESTLLEEVEELREENHRLQQTIRDTANQSSCQSPEVAESTFVDLGTSCATSTAAVYPVPSNAVLSTTITGHASEWSFGEVTAESTQTTTEYHPPAAKSETPHKEDSLNLFRHIGSKTGLSFQSLSCTTETLDEFKLGTWCSRGILNLEESPSEESDALRDAYRSLGFGEDLEALKEQRDRLEVALQHVQEQLEVLTQENTQLKLELRKEGGAEEAEESTREKMNTPLTCDGAENDLVQALNQENRALADRIQELLAHIELREEEFKKEETQQRDLISKLEVDSVRLEQQNQEQGGLITELTKKTEDDLNTIMELQQRLEDNEQHAEESQLQHENTAAISGCFQLNNLEECVESLVENVLKGEESYSMSSQLPDDSTTASVPKSQQKDHYDLLPCSLQGRSIQSLKTEQVELLSDINSLREQQREVALSVKTQTEVKQQLTRTVWGLKEEKDSIIKSLAGVKQQKEQLTRTVCGLRDEKDQFIKSMSGLKEEKEQLTECLLAFRTEKKTLFESVSCGKEERDQILESLQSLQTETERFSQAVLDLKQERDELTASVESLKEQKDQEQSSKTLQEDRDRLRKSVSSLKAEKERIEQSVGHLQEEEKQMQLELQSFREEKNSLQAAQTQQLLMNPNSPVTTKRLHTETLFEEEATQRCQTDAHRENTEQTRRLQSELHQSEARREEAERKAAQAADQLMRLTDVANQMEETSMENKNLTAQVKELQSKLRGVIKEKTDALSLKAQIEEQYNILTAQLKAKTVALEELNLEYIVLKQGQDSKEDVGAILVSLRTRYNDIRAKYDDLLKKRSQKDLEIAPLKAKLSCLVVKCQERNTLLVQMMKAMNRHGCVDPALTQQVEEVLGDTALQDYTATFTPGYKTKDYSAGFTPGFVSKLQDYTSGFTPDQSCSTLSLRVNQQNAFTPQFGGMCREVKSLEISSVTAEASKQHKNFKSKVPPAPAGTLKRSTSSPVQEHARIPETSSPVVSAPKTSLETETAQLPPFASGPTLAPEKPGCHQPAIKGTSSSDYARSTRSLLSPASLSSSTRVSVNRRLSSPEKILNLHEQLQKTLQSSYQTPVSRGRGQQPRKCLSFSDLAADPGPASVTQKQSFSFNKPLTNSLAVNTALSQAKFTPAVTATPVAKTTLYTAVTSRSANVTFSPNMFTNHHSKASVSKNTTPSSNPLLATMEASKAKSIPSSCTSVTKNPKPTKKNAVICDVPDALHEASPPSTLRTTSFDSNVLICSDTDPKTTASDTTAPSISAALEAYLSNMPPKAVGAASCTQFAHPSSERSIKSAALEKTQKARPQPGAPEEVRSVEVIKTVGQSSLMIGWERPTLDELGCSNGTFVYGYRVFVDGDFHKSVMSSACTKCILENVNLSLPVHISVQTLGSNGLSSNSVNTLYRTSVRTDQQSPD
ncbi:trichohyalin-like [Notolabrus celidotus]|uniref:trichohyalin-like n=1 Tax=Notolabrus celidotus TaxID=1203425 RepID=UPI00148FCDB8|nr:trichohyalin-like [Notolabrus celidotus]